MDKSKQIYDWEGILFPIELTQIESLTKHYDIPHNSILKIWRDDDYRLKGTIEGVVEDKDSLEYKENGKIKKAGFIQGETLQASCENNKYLIGGFGLESISYNAFKENQKIKLSFSCNIYLQKITLLNCDKIDQHIICDWHLCSMPDVFMGRNTTRYDSHPNYKFRNEIDEPIHDKDEHRLNKYSFSWDFAVLNHDDYTIIIQSVPCEYVPKKLDGVAIEYRAKKNKFPSVDFRKMVREYLSFIIGSHIEQIGSTVFNKDYVLQECESGNPWSLKINKQENINPIPLRNGSSRDIFENQLNKLFKNFIELYDRTSLSDCLWKLWTGSSLSIGSNLPIIASGFEMLVNSYLENKKLIKKYSKTENRKYRNLVSNELESLKDKLSNYDFGMFVINKIENPYNYGVGEKFNVFFDNLGFNFDNNSIEREALKARNLMTHSGIDAVTYESQIKIKKLSDAYITLMNRSILKLLKYDWYYIDYSKEGVRYKLMNENL